MSEQDLREIFEAYSHADEGLLNVLDMAQKRFGVDWIVQVTACMYGMEIHDSGGFPAEWLDGLEDDVL